MKAKIIKIGNSRGVRIPKVFLDESNLGEEVELRLDNGKITITPSPVKEKIDEGILMSHSALADWNDPAEDDAWAHLQ